MARAVRAKAEAVAPEPNLLGNQTLPRAATALFGHDAVMADLAARFAAAPPQGLILAGPRGIGKATLAYRIAKALVAGGPIASDFSLPPDNRDAGLVASGAHPRVLALTRPWDPDKKRFKTELTVDTVRAIVPFLGATTPGGGWRVVILDALDDMNANAANAILKALEEPPARTVFLMVAHAPGRILPTIRSRAALVALKPLQGADIAAALTHLGVDGAFADGSDGSVRAALVAAGAEGDAVRAARQLLEGAMGAPATWHRLAAIALDKKGAAYEAVVDLAMDALAARARHTGSGEGARAYLDALGERRRVEIFNLDKRAFLLGLCEALAELDAAA
ncbi:MAG: DNA polymerase III subunit delta' [Pseudomonadota bacterium]